MDTLFANKPVKKEVNKDVKNITELLFILTLCPLIPSTNRKAIKLWDKSYRVNYWGLKKIEGKEIEYSCVVNSSFIQIKEDGNSFKVINRVDN